MQNLSLTLALSLSLSLSHTTRAVSCFYFSSSPTHFNLHHYPYSFSCLLGQPIFSFPLHFYCGSWWNSKQTHLTAWRPVLFPFLSIFTSLSICDIFHYYCFHAVSFNPIFTIPLSFFRPPMKSNIASLSHETLNQSWQPKCKISC